MKNFFTKAIYFIAAITLFIGVSLPALAQHTAATLESGNNASAIAKDGSGNIYVLRIKSGTGTIGNGATAEIVKYVGGVGPAINVASNIPDEDQAGDWATGMAVASNKDIYYITDNGGAVPNGNIMKLTYLGGNSYSAAAVFKAGTGTQGFYTALAMDSADHLYAVQYDFNGDSNRNGIGSYTVIEFTSLASSTYTTLYQKLGEPGLDNAQNGSSSVSYTVPTGLAINSIGDVFVSDGFSQGAAIVDGGKIIKLTKASAYAASTISTGFSATSLAIDAGDNLFASQATSTTVPATAYALYEYAGATATQSPTQIYNPLHEGGSLYPFGIAIINDNNIYVTDGEDPASSFSNKVLEIFNVPATQATNVTFSNIATTSVTASWTNGDGTKRAVFIKLASSGNPTPVNSTTYTANVNFGSGTQIGGTGWYCVFNGTGTSVNITGLSVGQTYQVMAVEYNGTAGAENYDQSTATNNPNNFTTQSPTTINSLNRVTGQFTNASSVNFLATFGTTVTGVTASNFSVTTTGVSGVTNASIGTPTTGDGGITWTVPVSTGTGDGTIQLNLANATGLSKTISTSLPFSGQSYTIDKTAPTISIGAPSLSATNAGPVTYTVTYTDANFNSSTLANGNITLNTTGSATGSVNVTGSGTTRTVTISGITGDGTLGISIAAGTATDLAGNTAPASSASTTFNVDNTAPAISIGAPSVAFANASTSVTYTVTYSDANFNSSTLANGNITLNTTGSANGTIGVTGSGTTRTVTVSGLTGDGTLGISIAAGTATDLAGNTAPAAGPSSTFTVDTTVPTLTIATASANPTNAASVDYTVTFSEAVTGVDGSDFTVTTTSGSATGSVSGITGSGTTYTVTLSSVSGNGTLRLDLNGSGTGIQDAAGNSPAGFTSGQSYTIDATPPTLTSGSYFSNNGFSSQYAKVGDQITLSIGYNEPLQSLTMTIGGNPVSVTPSNGNMNWTGVYTETSGDTEGNVPWTLHGTDLAGNVRNYTNNDFGTLLIFDKTPPAVNISAPSAATVGTNTGNTVSYDVTYADANFNFSTLSTSDITLNTTGTATGTIGLSGSGSSYTVTISGITGLGTLGISVGANTAQDIPGNIAGASAPSTTFTVLKSDATLANLTTTAANFAPAFDANTTAYTADVQNAVTTTTVTPTVADIDATVGIQLNGGGFQPISSGTSSGPLALSLGSNTIDVQVTAQDGATIKTYTLTVNRARSSNALVNILSLNPATKLTRVPGTNYADYTGNIYGNGPTSVTVKPVTAESTATLTINGVASTPGVESAPITLNADTTAIAVTVTAGDGVTKKTYRMVLTRGPSNIALLATLSLNPATSITRVSGPDYADYTGNIYGNGPTSVKIIPVTVDNGATITVNGVAATSGVESAPVALNTDTTAIAVTVTAADGTTKKTYRVALTRLASNNARLTILSTNPKAKLTLVPGTNFADYTANIYGLAGTIKVTPITAESTATLTINGVPSTPGAESAPVALNADTTSIAVTVTAGNGTTKNTYRIVVTRLPSNNALLTTLSLTPRVKLTQVLGPDYSDYTATVTNSTSSVKVTPVTADNTATVTVNGVAATSGVESAPVTLNADTTSVAVTVTAFDGTTKKSYVILVTRQPVPPVMMVYDPSKEAPLENTPVVVHQNVSPNGDGRSDGLVIEGIAAHPDNKLQIMSRSGNLVYEAKGYDNATKVFDGHSSTNGKLQQAGTYFYSLEYKDGNETKRKTGFLVLKY